jgi:hypothetical protein
MKTLVTILCTRIQVWRRALSNTKHWCKPLNPAFGKKQILCHTMKNTVSWDVTPWSLVDVYRRFEGICLTECSGTLLDSNGGNSKYQLAATARPDMAENNILHSHRRENLQPHKVLYLSLLFTVSIYVFVLLPCDIRHEMSSPARTLGSWVRIPLKAWMFVCVYSVFVSSCVGSGLATG